MSKIRVTNPYFEKEYKVVEGRGDIECNLVLSQQGLRGFLILHTPDGDTITVNPSNCASIEIEADT